MRFTDQVVWITGASSGIGAALAKAAARRGARLILSARREAALEQVREEATRGGVPADRIAVLPFDVTDEAALDDIVARARAVFGRIDVLINNAGITQRSLALESDMAVYRRIMEVDFFAPVALTQKVLPIMVEQGGGYVAATSSVAGKIGVQLRTAYCAAKHALMGYFDALRAEMAEHNVGVSTIVPGFIRTDIAAAALKGDGSAAGGTSEAVAGGMDPDKAAQVIQRGLEREQPEIAVGEGREMLLLPLKRLSPRAVYKIAERLRTG